MTEPDARTLKEGQRVMWEQDATDTAVVIARNDSSLTLKWEATGMIGVYKFAAPSIAYLTRLENDDAH